MWCILFGLLILLPGVARSQAPDPAAHPPAYDIASIKPAKPEDGSTLLIRLDGFSANGLTLKALIQQAYGIEDDQILGAAKWVNSQTYDIEAKVDDANTAELEKLSEDQSKLMFQSFLADRFKLRVHWETKELPVLALVVARSGPKLQPAKPGDTYAEGIKGPDGKPAGHAGMMMWGRGSLTGQGIPIASMAPALTQELGRIVQDQTGLTGNYDVALHWTPDDAAPDARSASNNSGPSIFTALEEQLGLKIESRKAQVKVLLIDHADQPSAN